MHARTHQARSRCSLATKPLSSPVNIVDSSITVRCNVNIVHLEFEVRNALETWFNTFHWQLAKSCWRGKGQELLLTNLTSITGVDDGGRVLLLRLWVPDADNFATFGIIIEVSAIESVRINLESFRKREKRKKLLDLYCPSNSMEVYRGLHWQNNKVKHLISTLTKGHR